MSESKEAMFRSDIPVSLVPGATCGSDSIIARAAWVQKPGTIRDGESTTAYRRVIEAMLKGKHGTPFEKGLMTVYVEAPAVVWWEWTRHRFMGLDVEDFSFSLESGRYKVLDGTFYVPPKERPCLEPDGFKPMRPVLMSDVMAWAEARLAQVDIAAAAWKAYQRQIEMGIAREVARLYLPFSIYYAGYVEAKPRTWLQFFSLRTASAQAKHATFPQWEIEQVSKQCEALFAEQWPITHLAFQETGRVSP